MEFYQLHPTAPDFCGSRTIPTYRLIKNKTPIREGFEWAEQDCPQDQRAKLPCDLFCVREFDGMSVEYMPCIQGDKSMYTPRMAVEMAIKSTISMLSVPTAPELHQEGVFRRHEEGNANRSYLLL